MLVPSLFFQSSLTGFQDFTLLNNALLQYVGNADSAAGVSAKISEALVMFADNFDKVADGALQLAAVVPGALVGRSLLSVIRTLGTAGVALGQFRQALAAASTMGGLVKAFGGLGAAAGPVGMVIGGAVVSSLFSTIQLLPSGLRRWKRLRSLPATLSNRSADRTMRIPRTH